MDNSALRELDYGFNMAINTLVSAMGMFAENMNRENQGLSPAYSEKEFQELLDKNGINHNSVLNRWEGR